MEKHKEIKNRVNIGALALAVLFFLDSTAYGFKVIFFDDSLVPRKNEYQYYPHTVSRIEKDEVVMSPDGGPDQPEVQSFTPIGTSDMVDPFSGDFSYNIPLMDIDGYPINIAYSSGVTMDQEASWVGLGWNLNPGVVNRAMRGVPDEFNGKDKVEKTYNVADNWTIGGTLAADYELFGFGDEFADLTNSTGENESGSFSLSASIGIQYNNYTGFGSTFSLGVNVSGLGAQENSNTSMSAGLGFSGSSTGGATISPSVGLNLKGDDGAMNKLNIASPINSRQGFERASVSYSRLKNVSVETGKKNENGVRSGAKIEGKATRLPISSSYNFGSSSYTPQISFPMNAAGGTFSFKIGGDVAGNDLSGSLSGFYNKQWLKYTYQEVPTYGYMYLASGQANSNAMMDFNRENDGPFTKNTPALPIPNVTYDIFSVSGQGVSGSYRPVRKDIGYVFDPAINSGSVNGSLGIEVNLGGTFKGGIDLQASYSSSNSGPYNGSENDMAGILKYTNNNFYFREANELAVDSDPTHFGKIGGNTPLHFDVVNYKNIDGNLMYSPNSTFASYSNYTKSGEDRRNQVVYTLSHAELKAGLGIEALHPSSHALGTTDYDHHIGQFTVLNVEGSRYVYGIAAYSHFQQNVSFAVGANNDNPSPAGSGSCTSGLVDYTPNTDNSKSNSRGTDHYFSSVTTPDFAHSYLLTTVLNADYVDADDIKGPSKGDLGGYLTFDYEKIEDYHWRNPVQASKASYDEGLNTDATDDKGHYIYGEKELWYVDTIKSKNHIAIFHFSDRHDGHGVNGENGGMSTGNPCMQKLDSIQLFSLPDFEANGNAAIALKTVHFVYDYSLCPGYAQNIVGGAEGTGKLTLKKVFFTYQGSNKGRYSPYQFVYGYNPSYSSKASDRWNSYKPYPNCTGNVSTDPLRPTDFPYLGFDQVSVDKWTSAWTMTEIHLPSGGHIEVDYESDDYTYVQHKRAQNMLRIIGVHGDDANDPTDIVETGTRSVSNDNNKNAFIYVELIPGFTNTSDVSKYISPGQKVYFRTLMRFASGKFDFVPGYAVVGDSIPPEIVTLPSGTKALKIGLVGEKLKDNGSSEYNPIAVAGIQFGRLQLSKFIPPSSNTSVDENANLPGLAESIGGAFESLQEIFIGPNKPLWNDNVGTNLVLDRSWLRLQNPNKKKLGGGCRVKEIRMFDAFDVMTNNSMEGFSYGQKYSYTLEDGTSSGVAAYEPETGGDENPWRQPVSNTTEVLLAPDIRNYQETPFGEQFFPSARVGYSRVTIQDLPRNGVTRTATGKVVHEFYTAKDFPTIVKRTQVDYERMKIPVFAFFFNMMIDEMAASQGFVVENNDMHGKAKRQSVYAQGQTEPISKVEYFYQSEPFAFDGVPANHLANTVTTIEKNGQLTQSTIGLNYEAFADFRESNSQTISGSLNFNTNFTLPFILVPTIMGSGSYEKTAFRSATFTKVIERFGLQSKTVASDLGSVVETNNLAYDAETGTVLLTQTTTDFNDKVYSFTYPAHWYYDQMGQAYLNIGKMSGALSFVNGGASFANNGKFVRGDEVAIFTTNNPPALGWVVDASPTGVEVLLKDGTSLSGAVNNLKVLRSGRRNIQTTPIGTVALRSNPLSQLQGNIFDKVLQAGAVEYSDDWRTFCECFIDEEDVHFTTNPYVLGTRGTWRPKASYVHLAGRTQTFESENSNIREDGVFTSFKPFYELGNGIWVIDKQNWTYTSSVVEFSPFGQALETIDALDRYSSSMFGYNQTLPIAVAANTRYRQLGFDGFEDYDYDNCSDDHFRMGENAEIVDNKAHTGRKAIKVQAGNPVVFSNVFNEDCEDTPCMKVQTSIALSQQCPKCVPTMPSHVVSATLSPSLGIGPYQFDYNVIEGNPIIILNGNILEITNPSGEHISIIVTVTDANGCVEIIEL